MKKKMNIVLALFTALVMVMTMGASVFAGSGISSDEALNKALKNAKLKKSEVKAIDVEYDNDSDSYEVEFTRKKNGAEYAYEVGAESGKIFEKSIEYKYKKNSSHHKIGKTAARKKVAKYSGISYKIIKTGTCTYKYHDKKGVYKVKFEKGNRRYECEVLAPTGKILEYEWELIKR